MTVTTAQHIITTYCSQLPQLNSIRPLKHGFYNWVFLINEELVFRFPKRDSYNPIIEKTVLDCVYQQTELCTPHTFAVHVHPYFIATHFLPGITPTPQQFYSWSVSQKRSAATKLAHFLATLHQLRVPKLFQNISLPTYNFSKEIADIQAETASACTWTELTASTKIYLQNQAKIAASFLQNTLPQCIIHNDIHTENLLFSTPGQLTGVIDFDSVAIGTPTLDFALLGSTMGWSTLQNTIAEYHRHSPHSIDPAIAWAINVEYVVSLIHKSIKNGTQPHQLFLWWLNTARPGQDLTASDFPSRFD